MGKIRSLSGFLVAAAALCAACSGGADAQKKRIRELEEELTRVQNSHDRLDERVTSLELSRQVPEARASGPETSGEQPPDQPQAANLERPPLKVFRLGPSSGGSPAAQAAVEQEAAGEEEQGEPRPVIRGRGQNVEKAQGAAGVTGSKARAAKVSQNSSVPVAGNAKAPQ